MIKCGLPKMGDHLCRGVRARVRILLLWGIINFSQMRIQLYPILYGVTGVSHSGRDDFISGGNDLTMYDRKIKLSNLHSKAVVPP